MITITLLHPTQSTPIQTWRFPTESVIRIGRSSTNHVVLYSAVVSRKHIELRKIGEQWELINLGSNGTYVDGTMVTQIQLSNQAMIRLAVSGPTLKIYLHSTVLPTESKYPNFGASVNCETAEIETTEEDITESVSRLPD
ncbi:FHA domain-containing protein [Planktothricoides raciborskii]|uniref:FHA domain-containing protein n=2 Tax=Planktothricoides raciborskii TaxID=132608 RepID=A0AAU8J966_9CYAN|nr:FHA domain-containing protein [Planktothricoides raciborskii]KOR33847.1 hypothetical protein AM228_27435 [Planktothricoides sp. SR001]MBD2547880.1 FHA domain-containing protein [Planktothricoides raciborskii FACHB-1370]MBD2586285.1 FHA domain-containing protein [Planktothricoides raciborskii FACHB-1261]